jgi:hypothetical protein
LISACVSKVRSQRDALRHSKLHENMKLEIRFTTTDEVDPEVWGWLQKAYEQNSG